MTDNNLPASSPVEPGVPSGTGMDAFLRLLDAYSQAHIEAFEDGGPAEVECVRARERLIAAFASLRPAPASIAPGTPVGEAADAVCDRCGVRPRSNDDLQADGFSFLVCPVCRSVSAAIAPGTEEGDAATLSRALELVAEFKGDPRCSLNATHAEALAAALRSSRRRDERLEAEIGEVTAALPKGPEFLDPPDGGDVPIAEQVRRVVAALAAAQDREREAVKDSGYWRDKATHMAALLGMISATLCEPVSDKNIRDAKKSAETGIYVMREIVEEDRAATRPSSLEGRKNG